MKRPTAEKRETRVIQSRLGAASPGMYASILSFVVACLVPLLATAGTFYVDKSCSNNGDGTDATCAASSGGIGPWNSLARASDCPGMGEGDILEIRGGTYREGTWQLGSGCSGTSGDNVIIQNYAGEDVTLDGTTDISGSTWTARGGGVFECTSGTCGTSSKFPFTAWYDTGSGEERLVLVQTNRTCDSSVPVGGMRYTNGGNVCAHLSDGSNPANADFFRIPFTNSAIQLYSSGVDYLTLRKNPAGGSFKMERWRDHGITTTTTNVGIHYEGLEIAWMMDRGINQTEGGQTAAGYRIIDNILHHIGQEGIRMSEDTSISNLVDGNTVYSIQSEPVFERCQYNCLQGFTDGGTGIRVVTARNATITNNTLYDIGGARTCRSYAIDLEYGCEDCLVDSNYIYDSTPADCGSPPNVPQGILISGPNTHSYDGTVVSNNRIHNIYECLTVDLGGATGTVRIVNNTCSEPLIYGFEKQDGSGGTWEIANNIFTAESNTPRLLLKVNTSGYTQSHNVFYCPTCSAAGGDIVQWMGSTYERDSDCTPGDDCVGDLDPDSVYGDPGIVTSGAVPSLKMMSTSSLPHGLGLDSSCPPTDFEGDSRAGGCDIGADEFAGEPNAPPSSANEPERGMITLP
jgi:hypothetical protein